jgi:outer membrane usher protein
MRGLVACAAFLAAPSAASQVMGVEVRPAADQTRIVFHMKSRPRFSLLALRTPPRLLLEIEGTQPNRALQALGAKIGPDHPVVAAVRVQRLGTRGTRIEIRLKLEAEPRIHAEALGAGLGHRLVLAIPHPRRAPAKPAPQPAPAAPAEGEVWLEVQVNEQRLPTALFLRREGRLFARRADVQRWRLRPPDISPLRHEGEDYYPLDALRGATHRVDEAGQSLHLSVQPAAFTDTMLRGMPGGLAVPAPPPPGAFLNYDLFTLRAEGDPLARTSGLFELGLFGSPGLGLSSFLARHTSERSEAVRLDTTFIHDRPARMDSLRVGDAAGVPGAWGRSVRFGGVQWATNFATQPGFITFPLPALAGEAVVPSTVDLYVNDALRLRSDVPAGPFSIQDLPIVTGQGEARLVVRDALGREQVILLPYYASPRLLQRGLHDYAYEAGVVRENYTIASNDYGRAFAAGTHRYGLSDRFTAEGRVEVLRDSVTGGVAGALLWPAVGVLSASLAGSEGEDASGGRAGLGYERQTRRFGFGASTEVASRHFTQLGLQPGELAPVRQVQAFASLGSAGAGSFGIGYARRDFRDRDDVELASASYSIGFPRLGFFTLSFLRTLAPQSQSSATLTYTLPLGTRTVASASATAQRGGDQVIGQVQQNLPAGSGFGYRVLAGASEASERYEAGVAMQTEAGTYQLEAGEANAITVVRAGASGAVAALGGDYFLSRRLNESFAVVQVPGYGGARVYADNQPIARTRGDGSAIVPRLRPYERNRILIDEADLPLDSQIEALQADAVPYFRSGVLLRFAVRPARGALVTVLLEDGAPAPVGAVARLVGEEAEFPVGLKGELYLTGLSAQNRVRVTWNGRSCEFDLAFEPGADPLPHLGQRTCAGVQR